MIVKFFKGDHSAVTNGLCYLEGGTKRRCIAPLLLSGNPDITREWLKQASRFSKAFTYGCLSFEEADIPAYQKQQLMVSFEQTLLTGLTSQQYDIVWIEHRDKGRLELNFHIVNMELTTGKALTPYVHRRDITRINAWKCIANDTFGFTDPNDPLKARTFTFGDNSKPRRELMAQIDTYLFELAANEILNHQQDVIDALNKIEGITVTRKTKSSISFKAEGYQKPIRLKGAIYDQSYSGIKSLAAEQATRTLRFTAQREERLNSNKRKLKERNLHLASKRREIYQPASSKTTPPTLALSHLIESNSAGGGDAFRSISDTVVPSQSVPALPPSSKIKRASGTAVLPNNKAIENQNPINSNVNDHTYQPTSPSAWISQVLAKLREAITSFSGGTERREAEARKLGSIYLATQCECDRLNRLLKERKRWDIHLKQDRAFKLTVSTRIVRPL